MGTCTQLLQVSFPLRLHDGTEHDITGTALAVWREFREIDEALAALEQVVLVSAEVDGVELSDDQLRIFQATYGPVYSEALEWIALSTLEARVSTVH